jgi:hypothetical protein
MTSILPTPAEVRAAAARIASHVVRTPLIPSPGLSAIAGGEVLLKLECDQHGGSFKLRGALNALLSLTPAERARGVVASSAGNHGIGVAMAAELLQVPATIFVPATAPAVKREKIAARGARVDASCASYDAAESAARAHAAATGATFVSPCTGRALLAGAGTVGAEILDDLPSAGTIVVCVGGRRARGRRGRLRARDGAGRAHPRGAGVAHQRDVTRAAVGSPDGHPRPADTRRCARRRFPVVIVVSGRSRGAGGMRRCWRRARRRWTGSRRWTRTT